MPEVYYKIILGALVLISGCIRTYYEFRYHSIEKLKTYYDSRERFFVMVVGFCFTLPGTIYLFTGWVNFAAFEINTQTRIVACLMMLLNQVFFLWIHSTLGDNWSPILEIRKEQELITTGPYRYIRHPMYACIFIHAIMLLFVSANWVVGGMGLLSFAIIYPFRVRSEERMMLDTFGEKYFQYMQRTGRLLPKLF